MESSGGRVFWTEEILPEKARRHKGAGAIEKTERSKCDWNTVRGRWPEMRRKKKIDRH